LYAVSEAALRAYIYIDFGKMGNIYTDQLLEAGFAQLEGEDGALVPFFTGPVQKRDNLTKLYIGSHPTMLTLHEWIVTVIV